MSSALKTFLIWLPVFLVAFVVYSTCQGRIYESSDLKKSLKWAPEYSVGLLNQNDRFLEQGLTEAGANAVRERSIQALRAAPLSYRPFRQFGMVSVLLNSDNLKPNALIESRKYFLEANRRNGRDRNALRVLVNLDAQAQNFDDAIRNLDTLLRLNASDKVLESYYQSLSLLSNNPNARQKIDGYLEQQAPWGSTFLSNQIKSMTEANFRDVEHSLRTYSNGALNAKVIDKLNAQYLQKLTGMKKLDQAFEYWSGISVDQKDAKIYTVYNPNFEKRASLPPFNWQEVDHRKYFSEIDQGGGLYASYADSKVRALTAQSLRLQPGERYTLKVDAEWTYRRRQGTFSWIVSCLPSNTLVSVIDLDDGNKPNSGGEQNFQLPSEGCSHQSLSLVAKSGQYSQRIWSRTNSINITQIQ